MVPGEKLVLRRTRTSVIKGLGRTSVLMMTKGSSGSMDKHLHNDQCIYATPARSLMLETP
jgi:hypothetical protein